MLSLSVVVPNWNGKKSIGACLDSLLSQSLKCRIIVVENGSTDGSREYIQHSYPDVELVIHDENRGFAGGVNAGIRRSMEHGDQFVALLNNDAVADKNWLEILVEDMKTNELVGLATSKILSTDKGRIDSTGDQYTTWGLPYPRGRNEPVSDKYDHDTSVFAGSGGASLYRFKMLEEIGLFDEDFFAYYEDVDLSFRAQLAGWGIRYVPNAIVYHQIGATSSKIRGFTTYQTIKNLPWLLIKNVPGGRIFFTVTVRFLPSYTLFISSALVRGQIWSALKGVSVSLGLLPKKIIERYKIQSKRKVSKDYIFNIMVHDLPPNAQRLRKLRSLWRKA